MRWHIARVAFYLIGDYLFTVARSKFAHKWSPSILCPGIRPDTYTIFTAVGGSAENGSLSGLENNYLPEKTWPHLWHTQERCQLSSCYWYFAFSFRSARRAIPLTLTIISTPMDMEQIVSVILVECVQLPNSIIGPMISIPSIIPHPSILELPPSAGFCGGARS